jgi:prepilin-type N-terminal cleavage/methylation domain-containing protein
MRRDEGFTLIELLLSTAILSIIVTSITTALIVFLGNGTETMERDNHSAGAALTATYLDRDVSSADTVTTGGTTCSGSNNVVLLSGNEYTASTAAPSPSPVASAHRSAYAVVADPGSSAPDGSARYKLQRTACLGTVVQERTDLVPDLPGSTASASVVTDTSCRSGQALLVVLDGYAPDTTDDYSFRSCTKTRLNP